MKVIFEQCVPAVSAVSTDSTYTEINKSQRNRLQNKSDIWEVSAFSLCAAEGFVVLECGAALVSNLIPQFRDNVTKRR